MNCTNCGAPSPENANFCPRCGNEIVSTTKAVESKETPDQQDSGKVLKGVGGWLLFVVVGLILLRPSSIFQLMREDFATLEKLYPQLVSFGPWLEYKDLQHTVGIVTAAISAVAGILLVTLTKQSAVRFAIAALWITGPFYLVVSTAVLANAIPSVTFVDLFEPSIGQFLGMCFAVILWTLYFLKSKRVENTYVN